MDLLFLLGLVACPVGMAAIAGVAWVSGRTLGADSAPTRLAMRVSCVHHRRTGEQPTSPARLPVSGAQTFVFADLAGFSALTEARGDEQAAEVARRFVREARRLLPLYEAEEVKSLGDGLMIRARDPQSATRLALRIVASLGREDGFPLVRAGIHTGPAVERDGDWFGSTVNLAARVVAVASGGQVVVTHDVADALHAVDDIELTELPPRELRNIASPVSLFAARPRREALLDYPAAGTLREEVELSA